MLILMVRKSRTEEAEKQHALSPNQASGKKMSSRRLRKGPHQAGASPSLFGRAGRRVPGDPGLVPWLWTPIRLGQPQLARGRARGHGSYAPG